MDSASLVRRASSSPSSLSFHFSGSSILNPKHSHSTLKFRLHRVEKSQFRSLKCVQSHRPDSNRPSSFPVNLGCRSSPSSSSSFSCSVVTSSTPSPSPTAEVAAYKLQRLVAEFQTLVEPIDRVKRLLHYAMLLPSFDDAARFDSNRVMGCTAQVWLAAKMDEEGRMTFAADSDSEITRGFCSCLVWVLDGATPEEVLGLRTEDFAALNVGVAGRAQSRVNTWYNVLISMQKRTKALVAQREGRVPLDLFPSLVVTADGIQAKGSYAETQAKFLSPDEIKVKELVDVLREKKIGVAAHFYMDPEVQGVLTAAQKQWPHIHISDSLLMADMAVKMAEAGCQFITVLGVDFMSENVRAILDQSGFKEALFLPISSVSCSAHGHLY